MPEALGSGALGLEVVLKGPLLALPPGETVAAVCGGKGGGGCWASGFFLPKRVQPAIARHTATRIAKPPWRTSGPPKVECISREMGCNGTIPADGMQVKSDPAHCAAMRPTWPARHRQFRPDRFTFPISMASPKPEILCNRFHPTPLFLTIFSTNAMVRAFWEVS